MDSPVQPIKKKNRSFKGHYEKGKNQEASFYRRERQKPENPPLVNEEQTKKYSRGPSINYRDIRVGIERQKFYKNEEKIAKANELAAQREIGLTEHDGFLLPDEGEATVQLKQSDIVKSTDVLSACKRFDLDLREFGPYRLKYSKNGRHLLLGGRRGHVAAFDWITKKLMCEMNVMEGVHDVAWLHQETFFAVAQKKWVYMYDNQGVELHCLKKLYEVIKMEFLPYHFLLATVNLNGYLSWIDTSIGKMVAQFHVSSRGTAATIAQNPANAHICIGEPTGVVSFWSPNSQKAAITKWCHKQPVAAVAFDPKGTYFATSSVNRTMKLWDARNLQGPTQEFILPSPPRWMSFSQKGLLAMGLGNMVELRRDFAPYLRHKLTSSVGSLEFCPFEDVLGVAHGTGFSSLLVPGSAEPNIDALEINPFQSKSQRKEAEVKSLLEKIPAELISWNPRELQSVHVPSLEAIIEAKKNLLHVKAPDIKYTPKKKTGKASKTTFKRKTIVKEGMRKRYFEEIVQQQKQELEEVNIQSDESKQPKTVLDRFKPKKKKL